MKRILKESPCKRLLFFILADACIICASLYAAIFLSYENSAAVRFLGNAGNVLVPVLIFKLLILSVFHAYKITWRYVGLTELVNIFLAVALAELGLIVVSIPNLLFHGLAGYGLTWRIWIIDGIISFVLIASLRISKRLYLEIVQSSENAKNRKNTLIIGAGNTGEMLIRDLIRSRYKGFHPIGFLDDNRIKVGTYIHGARVLGTIDELEAMVAYYNVKAIIIAIPRLNNKTLRKLYDGAKKANVETVKIIPRIYDFSRPDVNIKTLENIHIEDLVGRETIRVDYQGIRQFVSGKSILITGAGGSIGSEIVNQICAFQPGQAILFDIDETELHNLSLKIQRLFPQLTGQITYETGDIRDEGRLREIFDCWKPDLVFHAAAYKHVPMMEANPKEAVKVNIFGTYRLASIACEYKVKKFIMISSDKAVRPTSVMGATKRMAEFICSALNDKSRHRFASFTDKKEPVLKFQDPQTRFISVRFGNVLGSRGSVLPLFLDQLQYGGPLTVTHREMKRYFMTIPEAVSLVLQASILGKGGEVFVLDMGNPVKILDIAEELIRIHGMEPYKDIDIQITEQRPGEKLFEEILTAEEGTDASLHEKIFVARNNAKYSLDALKEIILECESVIDDISPESNDKTRQLLKKYVKHYHPDESIDRSAAIDVAVGTK